MTPISPRAPKSSGLPNGSPCEYRRVSLRPAAQPITPAAAGAISPAPSGGVPVYAGAARSSGAAPALEGLSREGPYICPRCNGSGLEASHRTRLGPDTVPCRRCGGEGLISTIRLGEFNRRGPEPQPRERGRFAGSTLMGRLDIDGICAAVQDYGQACADEARRRPGEDGLAENVRARMAAWKRLLDLLDSARPAPQLKAPPAPERTPQQIAQTARRQRELANPAPSLAPVDPSDPASPCCGARVAFRIDELEEEYPLCCACQRPIEWTPAIRERCDREEIERRQAEQVAKTTHSTAARINGDHLGVGIDIKA